MHESRERFLREIVATIPVERIEEIRMFEPIRQGGKESGVALIAVMPDEPDPPPPPPADSYITTDATLADQRERPGQLFHPWDTDPAATSAPRRLVLYRGQYRLALKGADRGKWEVEIVAEADAPLSTVEDVVRGVQRRSGDDSEPERMTGEAVRASLAEGSWTGTP